MRCTLNFLQQLMRGTKKHFLKRQVPTLSIPAWPEMGVKRVWKHAQKIAGFSTYLPDDWRPDKIMERKFFYGILSAMSSDFVKELVNEATALRQAHRLSKVHHAEEMPISQEWAAALLSQPFIPCKYQTFNVGCVLKIIVILRLIVQRGMFHIQVSCKCGCGYQTILFEP